MYIQYTAVEEQKDDSAIYPYSLNFMLYCIKCFPNRVLSARLKDTTIKKHYFVLKGFGNLTEHLSTGTPEQKVCKD